MDVFIKDPEAAAEQIAGTVLGLSLCRSLSLCFVSPSPSAVSLSSSLAPLILLPAPLRSAVSPSSPAADEENPWAVGQRARQPLGGPLCCAEGPANHPLLLPMLFCRGFSIAQMLWCTCWGSTDSHLDAHTISNRSHKNSVVSINNKAAVCEVSHSFSLFYFNFWTVPLTNCSIHREILTASILKLSLKRIRTAVTLRCWLDSAVSQFRVRSLRRLRLKSNSITLVRPDRVRSHGC